jgi:hypothetical protein
MTVARHLVPTALLAATCLIAAFPRGEAGAGAEVANRLPYRAVLPATSSDGPALSTPADGQVVVGHLGQRLDGGLVVAGEFINNSDSPVTAVKGELALTVGGREVRQPVESLIRTIQPGETAPFQVLVPSVTTLASQLSGVVLSFVTAVSQPAMPASFGINGPYPFQTGPPDPKTGVIPYSATVEQFRGTVTNRSEAPLHRLEVVVAAYDAAGNVLVVATTPSLSVPFASSTEDPTLAPGTTAEFVVGLPLGLTLRTPGSVTFKGFLNAEQAS